MAAFAGKTFNSKNPYKKGGNMQPAYQTAAVKSLVKKGLRKSAKSKKRKHCYDRSNIDSNNEWEFRCSNTKLSVGKHLKIR
jgi:hypothetical protein